MRKLAMIVRGDNTGLGNQTRRLCYFLKPERIIYINSTGFSKVKEQHFDWYNSFTGYTINGFPNMREVEISLKGMTHFFTCETPYNFYYYEHARRLGIKTFCQTNYEFCDNLNHDYPIPDLFIMPSYWKVKEMKDRFGKDSVIHLPPPIDPNEFKGAREVNFNRKGKIRFLHMVGTLAANDRNGTLDLHNSLKFTKSDFELVIHSQQELPQEYMIKDSRVIYSMRSVENPEELYKDFDALILPRRYAGLCLPCNEALMSGLPVIMTDISPNNELLPKEWLVKARKKGSFVARTILDFYESDLRELAKKIDWLCQQKDTIKLQAFSLGHTNFANSSLLSKYEELFK